ncbi:hypothetical protein DN402_03940 [Streptomyces sp. SW4]|nr:hypothetical protein DN402_03940 [Streptomyces sp. SW4]
MASLVVAVVAFRGGGEPDGPPARAAASDPPATAAPADPALLALARRDAGDPYALGKPDAPSC